MKKILVTGGSSGIGNATCKFLSAKGFEVLGTSRNPKKAANTDVQLIELDLTDEDSIQKAFKTVSDKWGKLDGIVNNAGIGFMGPMELAKPEDIKKAWATNVFGLMRVTQIMLPLLKKSDDARIINIGSIGGKTGLPYRGWYSAAKGSLEILGESLSIELKPYGIQVCTLLPGDVKTNIADSRLETPVDQLGDYKEGYLSMKRVLNKEMSRAMPPEKIADTVLALLRRKNMPLKKTVGSWLHKFTPILKNILPQKVFQKLVINHYK